MFLPDRTKDSCWIFSNPGTFSDVVDRDRDVVAESVKISFNVALKLPKKWRNGLTRCRMRE